MITKLFNKLRGADEPAPASQRPGNAGSKSSNKSRRSGGNRGKGTPPAAAGKGAGQSAGGQAGAADTASASDENRGNNRRRRRGKRGGKRRRQQQEAATANNRNGAEQTEQPQDTQPNSTKPNNDKPNNDQPRAKKRRETAPTQDADDWDPSQFQVPAMPGKTRFHDLDLDPRLLHAIADLGFEYCSPIQAKSLPHTLQAKDVVGKAQTGTGKTAAFLVTLIDYLLKHPPEHQRYAGEARTLVIAPTRELVVQIAEDAKGLTKYTDLQIHTLVGGMDYNKQRNRLHDRYVDILVATPGRLLDFCGSQDVYLDQVEILVIDEADRMLDMGFIPQVRRIVRQTPEKKHRQTLLFSATFPDEVTYLTQQWTFHPVDVEIEPEKPAADSVEQHVYLLADEDKYRVVYNILQEPDVESVMIFANRRDQCRRLHESLERHDIPAGLLSGDIPQGKRLRTLDDFKSGKLKALVATDVAGRGIHIAGISHVINYTLPEEAEDYVHRIGRTGRAGKTGVSISFASEHDAFNLPAIEKLLGMKLDTEMVPEALLQEPPPFIHPRKPREEGSGGRGGNRGRGGRSGGGGRRG